MNELLNKTEEKMTKTIAALENEYKSIRAGRANAAVLDRITVDYYGAPTPIQQMAAVSMPEPRILITLPSFCGLIPISETRIAFSISFRVDASQG